LPSYRSSYAVGLAWVQSDRMTQSITITVRSHWQTKSMQAEVTVTHVTNREVSYAAMMYRPRRGVPQGLVTPTA